MTIVVDLGITLVYFSIFAILHSIAASNPLKRTVAAAFPGFMPYYRLSYNLFALVTLFISFFTSPQNRDIRSTISPPRLISFLLLSSY
ncbi:MAG: hypothetical protein IPJ75_13015 [Ignavibacteriales bacterium]|nr:hypothetical protein [Ignavibacteriales bacterium]